MLEEVERSIEAGAKTVKEIKRMTRAGMGFCQGRTCGRLVTQLLSKRGNIPLDRIELDTYRPPVRPIPLNELATGEVDCTETPSKIRRDERAREE